MLGSFYGVGLISLLEVKHLTYFCARGGYSMAIGMKYFIGLNFAPGDRLSNELNMNKDESGYKWYHKYNRNTEMTLPCTAKGRRNTIQKASMLLCSAITAACS